MSLSEILQGEKFKCVFCKGSGIQPHTLETRCAACGGKGGLVFNNPAIYCPSCRGKGITAGSSGLACIKCRGIGVVEKAEGAREVTEEPFKEIAKLGKYLRKLREEEGLSIRNVARGCSMTPSHLAKIETGDTFKTIGIETLVKLSKFYNIPVAHLLKEADFIEDESDELPEFSQYLRKKYQLSPQAIRDMEMAKEIVDKKYPK